MSEKIEQILEVVQEVREGFQNEPGGSSVKELRIDALYSVADRLGIQSTTVSYKFRVGLLPEIKNTAEFDRLLEDWLVSGSDELANILRQHTSDSGALELIETFFTSTSEPDSLVAQEPEYDPNDVHFTEGSLQLCLDLRRRRNRALVARAKERWNREYGGQLCCLICEFSFSRAYGDRGEGFIEAHHIQPVSEMGPDTEVTPDDLAPVCSNCHSILHRRRPWLTVDELRRIVLRQRDLESA